MTGILQKFYEGNEKILVAVDSVILGYEDGQLKILLFKRRIEPFKDQWSLIGRFVRPAEDIREAAIKVLEDYTGLGNIFLEQLFTFGKTQRDPGARVISIAYYALINIKSLLKKDSEEYDAKWFDIKDLPDLIMDHRSMIDKARETLIEKTQQYPIGNELLPTKFTLPQIFNLYQAIYDHPLDDRNFRKKILSMGILKKLDVKDMSNSKKGAFLYRFDKRKYKSKLQKGFDFRLNS